MHAVGDVVSVECAMQIICHHGSMLRVLSLLGLAVGRANGSNIKAMHGR